MFAVKIKVPVGSIRSPRAMSLCRALRLVAYSEIYGRVASLGNEMNDGTRNYSNTCYRSTVVMVAVIVMLVW